MTKILVIEDENDIREIISEILCAENYSVIEAEDGDIGVQLAQEELPDLVICDVMMPTVDGYGVLYSIRENASLQTVPFIFLTAKSSKTDVRLGMELGADDYLFKPFTRDELLGTVTTRLAKQVAVERKSQEKLDSLRDSVTSALPSELRSQLNTILSSSQFLIDNHALITSEDILERSQTIHQSGKRLYRLVQNFLLYSELRRIEKDPQQVKQFLKLDVQTATKSLLEEIAQKKAKQSNRVSDLQLELQPLTVAIAQSKLKKIFEELIDNAFKFSTTKTSVEIHTHSQDNQFQLFVIDNGRGMTAEQIANIGAYTQFDRDLYAREGSGLGLAIAKLLIELHGGELKIESIPNKQTIVHIILPQT
jgi:DNA-binding response OmpR family regulator/anti-sigma regulatory factor (Ser/Thr protein kinase)